MTDRARRLVVDKLQVITAETGEPAEAVLNRSIESGWQTVYPRNDRAQSKANGAIPYPKGFFDDQASGVHRA